MKRMFCLLLSAVMILGLLSGCGTFSAVLYYTEVLPILFRTSPESCPCAL